MSQNTTWTQSILRYDLETQLHRKYRTADVSEGVRIRPVKIVYFCVRPLNSHLMDFCGKERKLSDTLNKQIMWVCFVLTCLHAFLNSRLNKLTRLFPHSKNNQREMWLQWSIFRIIIYVYTFCIYPA